MSAILHLAGEETKLCFIIPFWLTSNEKLAEHPELYKDRSLPDDGAGSKQTDTSTDAPGQRQAATDQFMLERFRKRERHRVMRRWDALDSCHNPS